MSKFTAFISLKAKQAIKDESGAIAMMTGLIALVMLSVMAVSLDSARGYAVANRTVSALDSAAIAAARKLSKEGNTFNVQSFAQDYFDQQMQTMNAGTERETYGALNVTVDTAAGTVTARVIASVPTTLAKILHVDVMQVDKSVTIAYANQDLELALMLDVTGSMVSNTTTNSNGDTVTRLAAMKESVGTLADLLMKDTPGGGRVKVALAPYSGAVNAGTYANTVSDNRSTDGCVVERLNNAATDAAPSVANGFLRSVEDANAELGSGTYNRYRCPTAQVHRMTETKQTILDEVNSYAGDHYTGGHMGIAWAWYLISPAWNAVFGTNAAPYNDASTIKAVILMTDGRFNIAYQGSNVQSVNETESYATSQSLCDQMKAEGVVIFSVIFNESNAAANQNLEDCASVNPDTGNKQFYQAENGAALNAAYADIAANLSAIRITK